jgi:hypothetical protein
MNSLSLLSIFLCDVTDEIHQKYGKFNSCKISNTFIKLKFIYDYSHKYTDMTIQRLERTVI